MKELLGIAGSLVFWTVVLIVGFGFNPWSATANWVWQLAGKQPPFVARGQRVRIGKGRISESRVFVATAVKDGNVVQESIVARDMLAAKRIAADHWRLQPEDVDAAELVEKVLRR